MKRKVLITGGAGFIGFHLAKYLADKGHDVDLLDNLTRGVRDTELEELLSYSNVAFFSGDLLSIDFKKGLSNDYDWIFHLAAVVGVSHVLKQPYRVLHDNIVMMFQIIEFARKQKKLKRFFFASTSEVYAGTHAHFLLHVPTPEDTPLAVTNLRHPRTSYMLSKIYGEALCHHAKLPFTVFRPHNIYGPRMGLSHVIPELLNKIHDAGNGGTIDVFSPDHTRTFCFVQDAVKLIYEAALSHECENATINLGVQEPEITIRQLADTIIQVTGKKVSVHEQPATTGSPARRCPDMTYAGKMIGFQSVTSIEEGVKQTYEWYQRNVFEGKGVSAI